MYEINAAKCSISTEQSNTDEDNAEFHPHKWFISFHPNTFRCPCASETLYSPVTEIRSISLTHAWITTAIQTRAIIEQKMLILVQNRPNNMEYNTMQ